ncbi:hypothetical protein KAU88_07655 [Candidatus Bathyarchaeota archaeon]|nr:hypothetical protein [Candidatus Bathyarchaeota archaeon]
MNSQDKLDKTFATPTSRSRTKKTCEKKVVKRPEWQKHLAEPPKRKSRNSPTIRCRSSRQRAPVRFRPWVSVWVFVDRVWRKGLSLNRVLNEALLLWFEEGCESELKLRAQLARLLHEENELRQSMRVVLRSGAFLDSYAAKLVEGDEKLSVKLGRQPLAVLADRKEVEIVKRILARREAIVKEICEIEDQLLPEKQYVLKGSRSRQRMTYKRKGGEKQRLS